MIAPRLDWLEEQQQQLPESSTSSAAATTTPAAASRDETNPRDVPAESESANVAATSLQQQPQQQQQQPSQKKHRPVLVAVSIFVVSFVFAIAIVIGVCASGDCAASSSSRGAASSLRNSSNQNNATTATVPSPTVPTTTATTTIQPSLFAPPSLAPSDLTVTPSILPSCEYGYVQSWCTEPPLVAPTTVAASATTFSVPPSSHASSGYQSFVPSSWDGDDYNPPWMSSDTPTPTISSTTAMSRSDAIVAYINSITLSGRIIAGPATDSTDGNSDATASATMSPSSSSDIVAGTIATIATATPTATPTALGTGGTSSVDSSTSTTASASLLDFDRAEEQALHWIIHDDPLQLDIRLLPIATTAATLSGLQYQLQQRYALLCLWFSQRQPIYWPVSALVVVSSDDFSECNWYGIACTATSYFGDGSEARTVTMVDWTASNLTGALLSAAPDIGLLDNVRTFNLSNNAITGTLSSTIDRWLFVEHIDLSDNSLSGTLPESLGTLHYLLMFDVHHNSISGTIPTTLAGWTNVTHVDLSHNRLTGTVPAVAMQSWSHLQFVSVAANADLTGNMPDMTIMPLWNTLVTAWFNETQMTGSASFVCMGLTNLVSFVVDCAEVDCPCCSECY